MTFDDFFFCEKLNQRLAKSVCVQLQERAKVKGASQAKSLKHCRWCDEGKRIAAEPRAQGVGRTAQREGGV